MSKFISLKYTNYDYAPGIATYGINGKSGTVGKNGTSIFVCRFNLFSAATTDDDFNKFGLSIRQNLDMSETSSEPMPRAYINGDCFLFPNGDIYKITNIDALKKASISNNMNSNSNNLSQYMTKVGAVNISQSDTGFGSSQNRLTLDTANYLGFLINTANVDDNSIMDIKAPLTIIANDTDNDGNVNFIDMKSVYSGSAESELKIYYDSDNDSFFLSSDKPIVIDADVKINLDNTENFDSYSSVMLKDNSITSWHGYCENLGYYTENTQEDTTVKFHLINNNPSSAFRSMTVHITVYDNTIYETLYENDALDKINEIFEESENPLVDEQIEVFKNICKEMKLSFVKKESDDIYATTDSQNNIINLLFIQIETSIDNDGYLIEADEHTIRLINEGSFKVSLIGPVEIYID